MVGSLFAYKYLLGIFGQEDLVVTNIINKKSLLMFIGYCTWLVAIVTIFFRNRYKKIFQLLLIWSLFFIAIAYGGFLIGVNVLIIYYLISAYAEEYLKYSSGNNLMIAEKENNPSNLIFFCILIGLGFSVIENIIYIINNIINQESVNIINLIVGRWLVSTLIHMVSTGLIAFIVIKNKKTDRIIMPILLGIIWWFWIHSIYNISLQYHLTYITVPLIIIAFFLMTYLTFQSDMMYKQ